jgi:hypothetical protein
MHAAGAAGAVVAIGDCGGQETHSTAFYGAACLDGSCVAMTDSGADAINANDANGTVFYGAACLDGSCLPPQDAGSGGPDAPADTADEVEDAGTNEGPGDAPGGG